MTKPYSICFGFILWVFFPSQNTSFSTLNWSCNLLALHRCLKLKQTSELRNIRTQNTKAESAVMALCADLVWFPANPSGDLQSKTSVNAVLQFVLCLKNWYGYEIIPSLMQSRVLLSLANRSSFGLTGRASLSEIFPDVAVNGVHRLVISALSMLFLL